MNLDKRNLGITLLLALLAFIWGPIFFPRWHLTYFAPFLVIVWYRYPFIKSVWFGLICGFCIDLLTDDIRFGSHALAYALTVAFLFQQKQYFFADAFGTLPLMTFSFAVLSSLLRISFLYMSGYIIPLSQETILTDLLYLPALDALYGFIVFQIPFWLFTKRSRRTSDYFMDRA